MAYFTPLLPYDVPLMLLVPSYTTVNGVTKKTFPSVANGVLFYASFKSYGGTEREVNGLYTVEDTANIETWYRPDIKSGCRVAMPGTNAVYDIMGEPENINMRNQFLKFKIIRTKGGA